MRLWLWLVGLWRIIRRGRLWLVPVLLVLAGCGSLSGLIGGNVQFNTSPQADAMRTCAALVDILTPGVSPLAALTIAKGALIGGGALGVDPGEAMLECAGIYDGLTP